MQTNRIPHYDNSVNTTGCCPKFNPEGWDSQRLRFQDKPFVRATTKSVMHIPVNMGSVFNRVQVHIENAGGFDDDNTLVLSNELSPWQAEHLFATDRPVEGEEAVKLTGDFYTRVFEGPYRKAKDWHSEMQNAVKDIGGTPGAVYFFYTTCPKCAKAYGKNYVVAIAEIQ